MFITLRHMPARKPEKRAPTILRRDAGQESHTDSLSTKVPVKQGPLHNYEQFLHTALHYSLKSLQERDKIHLNF
jgi:hypothetical protein